MVIKCTQSARMRPNRRSSLGLCSAMGLPAKRARSNLIKSKRVRFSGFFSGRDSERSEFRSSTMQTGVKQKPTFFSPISCPAALGYTRVTAAMRSSFLARKTPLYSPFSGQIEGDQQLGCPVRLISFQNTRASLEKSQIGTVLEIKISSLYLTIGVAEIVLKTGPI